MDIPVFYPPEDRVSPQGIEFTTYGGYVRINDVAISVTDIMYHAPMEEIANDFDGVGTAVDRYLAKYGHMIALCTEEEQTGELAACYYQGDLRKCACVSCMYYTIGDGMGSLRPVSKERKEKALGTVTEAIALAAKAKEKKDRQVREKVWVSELATRILLEVELRMAEGEKVIAAIIPYPEYHRAYEYVSAHKVKGLYVIPVTSELGLLQHHLPIHFTSNLRDNEIAVAVMPKVKDKLRRLVLRR